MISVIHIEDKEALDNAFSIREKVYIEEQQIDRADEFDEYEDSSQHFLAYSDQIPCGTARYRQTAEGIKLERFAVLPIARRIGMASKIMQAMLNHIEEVKTAPIKLYLNAQLTAMPLYAKFGFEPSGDIFMECDIEHQKMILQK